MIGARFLDAQRAPQPKGCGFSKHVDMKIILMGPQGSGKGTQAEFLSKEFKIPPISAGQLLRQTNGKIKEEIEDYINNGKLVPNDLVIKIIKNRISESDCKNGFILDGFPRSLEQAKELDKITKIDFVIEITLNDEEAIRRLSSRLNCPKCGALYNILTKIPKRANICDLCLSNLIKRDDDKEEAIKKRLEIYHTETRKLKSHYPKDKLIIIDGSYEIKEVWKSINHQNLKR